MDSLLVAGNILPLLFSPVYMPLSGGGVFPSSTPLGFYGYSQIISAQGIIKNLKFFVDITPDAGVVYTCTLYKNGVGTTLTCSLSHGDTTTYDTTHTISVIGGDFVCVGFTYTGSPTTESIPFWSAVFQSTNAHESNLVALLAAGGSVVTQYAPLTQASYVSSITSGSEIMQIMPTSGTLKNLYAACYEYDDDISYVVTLYVNDSPTNLTVTMASNSPPASDTTHSIPVSAGDIVYWVTTGPGDNNACHVTAGVTFVADIDHESILLGGEYYAPPHHMPTYAPISTQGDVPWRFREETIYDPIRQGGQSGFSLKKFYIRSNEVTTDLATLTIRCNLSSTGIVAVIITGSQSAYDISHGFILPDFCWLDVEAYPLADSLSYHWGIVVTDRQETAIPDVLSLGSGVAAGTGWYSTYRHRKKMMVQGADTSSLTNWVQTLTVYKTTGNDTPGVKYCNNACLDDFSDIIFTSDDDMTLLSSTKKNVVAGVSAQFDVTLDTVPASPDLGIYYMYYNG